MLRRNKRPAVVTQHTCFNKCKQRKVHHFGFYLGSWLRACMCETCVRACCRLGLV